jgi:hypothetical protein
MTTDAAIRIVLHFAEVVHFTHTIRLLIMWAPPRITTYAMTSSRSIMFQRPILAQTPPPRDVSLNTSVQLAVRDVQSSQPLVTPE